MSRGVYHLRRHRLRGSNAGPGIGRKAMDIDGYIWRWDTEIPHTVLRPWQERVEALMETVPKGRRFVMTGSMDSIRKLSPPLFELATF